MLQSTLVASLPNLYLSTILLLLARTTTGTCTGDDSLAPIGEPSDSVHIGRAQGSKRPCSTQALLRRETSLIGLDIRARKDDDDNGDKDDKDVYATTNDTSWPKPKACQAAPRDAFDIPVGEECPQLCPYWGEVYKDSACQFKCVAAGQCGSAALGLRPERTIAEDNGKFCRGCRAAGCLQCARNGKDECAECDSGYALRDGQCVGDVRVKWHVLFPGVLVGGIFIYFVLYLLDLFCRPVVNTRGYEQGQRHRARTKSRKPHGENQEDIELRTLWPLSTNLLSECIAGPGAVLHFRFQFAWILWAFFITVFWYILAVSQEKELLVLGTKLAETPKDLCYVIDWGAKLQKDYMGTKVLFILVCYVFTVVFSFALAVSQSICFHRLDAQSSTMHDFAAICGGLPKIAGTEPVEEQLKGFLETETGQSLVGVSVAWGYFDDQGAVSSFVGDELMNADEVLPADPDDSGVLPSDAPPLNQSRPWRWMLFGVIDRCMIWLMGAEEDQGHGKAHVQGHAATRLVHRALERKGGQGEDEIEIECKEFLEALETTDTAFAIFETEKARDDAIEAIKEKSPTFNGSPITLRECKVEPESIRWCAFNCSVEREHQRLAAAVLGVFVFLFVWFLLFYVPYAYFFYSYPYESGGRPDGEKSGYIFTAIVVGGNLSVYCVCAIVVGMVGFRYDDEREAGYIVLYFVAIIANTILDMALLGFNSFSLMVAVGAHTSDNKLLAEVDSLQDRFESYPIQKEIGENFAYYNWPCCFFLPFVGEAIAANILPWLMTKYMVLTNPEITGRRAECLMEVFVPMDMGRYSDIILNCALAALMVWLPCGFNLSVFGGLTFSNIFIYLFDHYRTLRVVPHFHLSDRNIDDWAMSLSSVIPAIFLSALIFKANCTPHVSYCKRGSGEIFFYSFIAFVAHICAHLAILNLIREITFVQHTRTEMTYTDVATWAPCTYFSTNPINCLRSKCFYTHDPPCSFYNKGREHLMRKNPELGQHFEDKRPAPVDK